MTARTPETAADMLCPLSRTFAASPALKGCQGPYCALWRWSELHASILIPFVQARIANQKERGGPASHKEAVAWVMENREALGIPTTPTHGYCGLGGPI